MQNESQNLDKEENDSYKSVTGWHIYCNSASFSLCK